LWFDRIVVGGNEQEALQKVLDIYRRIEARRDSIAALAGIAAPAGKQEGRYITTSLESAEMTKVVSNAFLALKISFTNSVAQLADKAGADIMEVMDAVGTDARIGHAFLQAGRGYGGGCFPKDVSGLIASGLEMGVDLTIMQAAQAVNEQISERYITKLQEALGGSLKGRKIAVLGLSFKAGTSDARRSAGVAMANQLNERGAIVAAYDPQAREEAAHFLDDDGMLAGSLKSAIDTAEAIIIATDWPEFIDYALADYAAATNGGLLVDAMNRFEPEAVRAAGLQYAGIGRR
jgi:UDPglucose 6-dehydrogenase